MPIAFVRSFCLVGVEAVPVGVEVDLLRRLPAVVIVGLPAATARETADRVRSAILSAGFDFPRLRVVVNVTPADLRKGGNGLDLPIALAILVASGQVDPSVVEGRAFVGELSLSGDVRGVRGALACGAAARLLGVPLVTGWRDASMVAPTHGEGAGTVRGVGTLRDATDPGAWTSPPVPSCVDAVDEERGRLGLDFVDVRGNEHAIPLLVDAATTRRPVLLRGYPGTGRVMLAARMAGLLREMTTPEAIGVATIHEAAGLLREGGDVRLMPRPFRAPHHTVSAAGLVGGTVGLQPREATLAHRGVLFVDDFPEMTRATFGALRPVVKKGEISIARTTGRVDLPADAWIVLACSPCGCGTTRADRCTCTPEGRDGYAARIALHLEAAGLVGDRAPVVIDLKAAAIDAPPWPCTADLAARVVAARVEATIARGVASLDRGILCYSCGYDEPGKGPADREHAPPCPDCGSGATGIRWMLGADVCASVRAERGPAWAQRRGRLDAEAAAPVVVRDVDDAAGSPVVDLDTCSAGRA